MKPKYRTLTRILPTAVSIALSLPFVAQAGIFADDTGGNAQPTAVDNGANTIRANGGTSLTPFVSISGAVNMTGDAGETEVLEITAVNYTVTNLGVLSGTDHHGINSTQSFTLTNSGTIAGGGASRRGVLTTNATITNNSGALITGTDDAIHFTSDGGSVTNSGTLSGTTNANSDGIRGRNNLVVSNLAGGSITGFTAGIYADDGLTLTNANTGSIFGGTLVGVRGNNTASITNNGIIDSDNIGVQVTDFSTITNGGLIEGLVDAIVLDDDNTVTNSGTIFGTNDDGIQGDDRNTVTNNLVSGMIIGNDAGVVLDDDNIVTNFGSITGNNTGVFMDANSTVTNEGTITGTNTYGVRIGGNSTVTNSGTITGFLGIEALGGTFLLNNTGIITGTNGIAIDGAATAVDTINLNAGSLVTGDINLGAGADTITMTKSALGSSIVNGNINSGTDTDTLTFEGGMTTAGGFTNHVTGNITFMQDIIKNGSGTAFITGNVDSDTIVVNNGALYIVGDVDGTLVPQTVITVDEAEIGGTGTWNANITVTDGTISPGSINLPVASNVADSIGTLTVTGDVTLDSGSQYVWNATPGGASDLIVLSGAGNQFTAGSADFLISPTNVNTPLLNGSTIVVQTGDALIGTFDDILLASFPSTTPDTGSFTANQINPILTNNFASLTQVDGGTDWQLTIVHDYSQFGATPNEVAAGNMLDGLVATATGNVADLLASMDYSNAAYAQSVLAALDPGSDMAAAAGVANNNYQLHRTVEGHNAAVRAGQADCDGATNVWGGFSYNWQDLNASTTGPNSFDQDGETTSFHAGVDFSVAENFRLGVVAQGSETDWSGSAAATDVDSYRFAAYANWGAATGWFVDALLGYNSNEVDHARATGTSFDADGWQGMINVGYAVETSAGTFSPFVGLEWQELSVDGYDSSLGPIPIGIDSYDIESFRALAGVRWEGQISNTIKGYASAAYAFEFEDDAATTTVAFGGGSYTAEGLEQGDALLISAGLRWSVTDCTTIDLGYNGEFASDDGVDSNSANVGVNYSF